MNKFWLVLAGIIAGIIALSTLGEILGLGIAGLLVILGVHFYAKSDSSLLKVFWAIVGVVGLISAISNIPGLFGILAIVALYYIVKKWGETDSSSSIVHIEKTWKDASK